MKNDWRSWKTNGDWLTDGQKRRLDNIVGMIIAATFVVIFLFFVPLGQFGH